MVTLYHAVWTGASWLYMILQIHLVHVLYSHCLQGYQDSSWVVCKCFFNFTLCLVFYSHWLPGIMILCKLSLCDSFYVFFFIHIGYRGIIILHELVSMWFFKFSLSVVMYSQWLQGYHDSLWVVSKWFFNFALCVILYSHWLFVSWFFVSCLYVIFQLCFVFLHSHWLQGNLVTSRNVSMWFFEFTLCVVFSLVTGVSWFFMSCL